MTLAAALGPASDLDAAGALLTAAVLMLLPGYGLLRLLARDTDRLLAVAAAPAVTAGALYVVGEIMSTLGVPVDYRLGVVAVGLGAAAAVLAHRIRPMSADPRNRMLALALLAAIMFGGLVWALGIQHLGAVPPHDDGLNHGFFTARIDITHSLTPADVLVKDVITGGSAATFYPFALHQQAAMVMQVTGVDAGLAFTLVSLLYVVVALPAGMALLTRRLFPSLPTAAPMAAIVSALVPTLAYSTSWWGGYPMVAGLAIVPGAVELALRTGERRRLGLGALAALAVAGTAGVHTSALPLVPIIVTFMLFGHHRQADEPALWHRAIWSAVAMAASLALLAPALAQLAGGYNERQYGVPHQLLPLGRALAKAGLLLQFTPPETPVVLILLFWLGLIATFVRKQGRCWSALWLTFATLFVWLAAAPSSLIVKLTAVWYSLPFRLVYILAFLSIPLVGSALARLLNVAGGVRREPFLLEPSTATASAGFVRLGLVRSLAVPVTGVLLAALAVPATVTSIRAIRDNYARYSLISSDARHAFAYLQAHVRPGEHVLNQRQDGSPWMYSLAGVAPLIPLKTDDFDGPRWADKRYLVRHAAEADADPRVRHLLAEYRIRLVYVDQKVFSTDRSALDASTLATSPAYREVFHSGSAFVFEVVPPS